MRTCGIVWVCVVACASVPRAAAQEGTLEALLDRAGRYTLVFVDKFSNVVAEERYVQRSSSSQGARRRVITSDFLLVRPSEATSYMPFRDVFEVDGVQVRDREQRLEKLFLGRLRLDGDATYGRFRRFDVTTDETIQTPKR